MPRINIPFNGPAYESESLFLSPQRCVNFYLRPYPGEEENSMALFGTPGLELWTTPGDAVQVRASLQEGAYLYVVVGASFYRISADGTANILGALHTAIGDVGIASNGLDVTLVDGANGYSYDIGTGTYADIVDPDFPGGDTIVIVDGYYLVNRPNTGQLWRSDFNNGLSWNGLSFDTEGGDPDNIVGLLVDHRDIYVGGERSLGIWYNTGAPTFNFARIEGAFIEQGIVSAFGMTKANNAVYFVGRDRNGRGQVFEVVGRMPKVISTIPITRAISGYTLEDMKALAYQQDGHTHIIFSFPTDGVTWVYDSTIGQWHERSSRFAGAVDGRWRVHTHSMFNGEHIVGDCINGKLYKLKSDVYDEDGTHIISDRITGIHRDRQNDITVDSVQILNEPGVGLVTGTAAELNPQMVFTFSRDGGRTWLSGGNLPMGKIGEVTNRAISYQLGQGSNWVFRIRIDTPVKRVIAGAIAEFEEDDA